MKKRHILILFIGLMTLCFNLAAQDGAQPVRATAPLSKYDKMFPQIKYGKNVYRKGSNWFMFGYGPSYHLNKEALNYNLQLAFHWRYKAMYFNAGWHSASPEQKLFLARPMEQLNDIYGGAGLRFEDRWYNFGFFIGPSFAITWLPESNSLSKINYQLGAYTEVQCTFKYFYDLGIGTSIYGSFNKRYQVVGARIHLYFSNAFVTKY
ncbi:MAG: hypothetical protein PHP52_03295 [Bacteroidales bacterium]|nr:hypothetical protein [Bacteroidales bacterium]MDD4217860.1 hypothetical protein [Bacteroidales bacterium]MDY0142005.1 hypothetical protein [Bacteroidales bacterium]